MTTAQIKLDDDDEYLDEEWISRFTKRAPYTFDITGTHFFLHKIAGSHYMWEIAEQLEDGDELTWCIVQTRGQCRRMIKKLCGINTTPVRMRFIDAPLGCRFRHFGCAQIWIKLSTERCGIIAQYEEAMMQSKWPSQSICSFEESDELMRTTEIEVIG